MVTTAYSVGTITELNTAIAAISLGGAQVATNTAYTITFNASFNTGLTRMSTIQLDTGSSLTVDGASKVYSGSAAVSGFIVAQGTVAIKDLSIMNTVAQGGDGVTGGGGGAGLGGGLLVAAQGAVTLTNVGFSNNSARGGAGTTQAGTGGGGGGMFTSAVGTAGGTGPFGNGGTGGGAGNTAGTDGAYGSGGGAGGGTFTAGGGTGGFGGGSGAYGSAATDAGSKIAPFGGGNGQGVNGGGGGGLGGAIFVQEGGVLSIGGTATLTANTVVAGTSTGTDQAADKGKAFGAGIFLAGNNNITLNPGAGQTLTISDQISDQKGSIFVYPQIAGLILTGAGTVQLRAANAYTGKTQLNAGTLEIDNPTSAGAGAIRFGTGAQTLKLTGTAASTVGTLANAIELFNAGDKVDVAGIGLAASFTFVGNTLTLKDGGAATLKALTFTGTYSAGNFSIATDGAGGTLISSTLASPVVTSGAVLAFLRGLPAAAISAAATVTDADSGNFNTGSLTVAFTANGAATDQLSIITDAIVTVAGNAVSVSGAQVGTINAGFTGANGANLKIDFTTVDSTPANVATLLRHIGYANDTGNAASKTVTFTVDDNSGAPVGTATATVTLGVPAPPTSAPPSGPNSTPPPSSAPVVSASFNNLLRYTNTAANPLPATVTTPDGKVLPNPLLEQQKAINALIAQVDAGTLTYKQALDVIVDMADATTSVATMGYQFFTHKLPTKDGLDYLTNSPSNPTDINDGYYAGMSVENRYINFAVNLGRDGEGRADFQANYGALSFNDATAKAYAEIFGKSADAAKLAAILTPERVAYFNALGGDALGAKAAMVGFFLGEAAKTDIGPYAVANENFLYDLADGTAAYGANAGIYINAGPTVVGLVGQAEVFG